MSATLNQQKFDILVLARLATTARKAPTLGALSKSLRAYTERQLSPGEQRAHTEQALGRLAERGDITPRPIVLTDTGRQRLREFFGVTKDLHWSVLKKHYLTARALALDPTDKNRRRIADKNGLRAGVLWRHHQLPQPSPPTLTQAVDALVWRQLGVDAEGPLTLSKIRAHFLREMLGTRRALSREKLEQLAAARAARSDGIKPDQLRLSLVQGWLFGDGTDNSDERPTPSSPTPSSPTPSGLGTSRPTLEALAEQAMTIAATIDDDGRFGDHKVFISAIWQRIRELPACEGMTLTEFKQHLIHANRASLVRLLRADLVPVMPMKHVLASEIHHLNATFHFVESRLERTA